MQYAIIWVSTRGQIHRVAGSQTRKERESLMETICRSQIVVAMSNSPEARGDSRVVLITDRRRFVYLVPQELAQRFVEQVFRDHPESCTAK